MQLTLFKSEVPWGTSGSLIRQRVRLLAQRRGPVVRTGRAEASMRVANKKSKT